MIKKTAGSLDGVIPRIHCRQDALTLGAALFHSGVLA